MSSSETSSPRRPNTSAAAARMRSRLRSASARRGRALIRADRTTKEEAAPPLGCYKEESTPPLPEETDVPRFLPRAPLADPGTDRRRPADDRARPDDREHRAAERAAGPRLHERRPPVDHHRLRAR